MKYLSLCKIAKVDSDRYLARDKDIVHVIKSMKIIDLGNSDKPYNKAKTDKDIKEPRDEALTIFIRSDSSYIATYLYTVQINRMVII